MQVERRVKIRLKLLRLSIPPSRLSGRRPLVAGNNTGYPLDPRGYALWDLSTQSE